MTSDVKSLASEESGAAGDGDARKSGGWMTVGAIAAASAVLGGLAAAWYYRKELSQLREAENEIPDSAQETTGYGMGEDF
jgi:hypothetical protein